MSMLSPLTRARVSSVLRGHCVKQVGDRICSQSSDTCLNLLFDIKVLWDESHFPSNTYIISRVSMGLY